jgi:hypothetical protein
MPRVLVIGSHMNMNLCFHGLHSFQFFAVLKKRSIYVSVCSVYAYIYVTLNKRKQENHLELCPTNMHSEPLCEMVLIDLS